MSIVYITVDGKTSIFRLLVYTVSVNTYVGVSVCVLVCECVYDGV